MSGIILQHILSFHIFFWTPIDSLDFLQIEDFNPSLILVPSCLVIGISGLAHSLLD